MYVKENAQAILHKYTGQFVPANPTRKTKDEIKQPIRIKRNVSNEHGA